MDLPPWVNRCGPEERREVHFWWALAHYLHNYRDLIVGLDYDDFRRWRKTRYFREERCRR